MSFQPASPRGLVSTGGSANQHDRQHPLPDNTSLQALPHGDGYIFNDQVYIPSQPPQFFLHDGDLVLQQVLHPQAPPPPYEAIDAGQSRQAGQPSIVLEGGILRRGYTLTGADCIAIARGLCDHHHVDQANDPLVRSAHLLRTITYNDSELPHPDIVAAGCMLCLRQGINTTASAPSTATVRISPP